MKRRILGRTGISVSQFALGTMMFGGMGNADHDESIAMTHQALDAGINFVDTADVYSQGESEVIVGKGAQRAPRRGRARHQVQLADGRRREPAGRLAALDQARDRVVAVSPDQIVEAQWVAERRGHHRFRTEQPPYSIPLRGIEQEMLPTAQRYGMGVLSFGPLCSGWLSGRADPTTGHRAQGGGARLFDMSTPANQAKLEAVEQLTALAMDSGLKLAHLATAFALAIPRSRRCSSAHAVPNT